MREALLSRRSIDRSQVLSSEHRFGRHLRLVAVLDASELTAGQVEEAMNVGCDVIERRGGHAATLLAGGVLFGVLIRERVRPACSRGSPQRMAALGRIRHDHSECGRAITGIHSLRAHPDV
jgi:hypothetical protein